MSYANNVKVLLTGLVGLDDTTITFTNAVPPFANPPADGGTITLSDNLHSPTKLEVIEYTAVVNNGNGSSTLTGCVRGAEGTTKRTWAINHVMYQALTAGSANTIVATINNLVAATTNIDNTSDADKPISIATQFALDSLNVENWDTAFTWGNHASGGYAQASAISNIDNTSDLAKPISTAAQTALNGKAATSHTHAATDLTEFVPKTGNYGTVQVTGTSWQGYSINGTHCYIAESGGGSGLYDDVNDAWLVYAISSGAVNLYYAGSSKLATTTAGITVTGTITATSNITAYSDERLKTDWADLDLDFLDRLADVTTGTYTRTDTGERQVGVSAQDIQQILPEAVVEDDEGVLSLAYGNAALVACVELANEVQSLRLQVEELKNDSSS